MKKIILSVAAAAMALTTTASALEDIKVKGSAKLWYETQNGDTATTDHGMFNKSTGNGEFTLKLDVTGKQGNVGFGATIYDSSSIGLENQLVAGSRSGGTVANGGMFLGQAYITAPMGKSTTLKIGKQELQTPLAFTEKWASVNNAYNAIVALHKVNPSLTLVGAYVGQTNGRSFGGQDMTFGEASGSDNGGAASAADLDAFAAAALYKANGITANVWGYSITHAADAVWIDAATKIGSVGVKGYAVSVMPTASGVDDTTAFAGSVSTKVGSVKLFGAASTVSDGALHVANYGTNGKKTKLPTMGVYTDGAYVAQPGATSFKVKAATKMAGAGVALQVISSMNDKNYNGVADTNRDMLEADLIIAKKMGDFNVKGILMHRDGQGPAMKTQDEAQQHIRIVTSVNF